MMNKKNLFKIMDKKICFRAWDTQNKKMWVHFDAFLLLDISTGRAFNTVEDTYMPEHRYIFMPFIGLYDKNLMEVYAGDIIKWEGHYIGDHWVKTGRGIIAYEAPSFNIIDHDVKLWDVVCGCNGEVIGNIFESPELINSL